MSKIDTQTYLDDYSRAFARANPGQRVVSLNNNHGWYYIITEGGKYGGKTGPYRLRQLKEMTKVLELRADAEGIEYKERDA